ncbi:unnamed protein product [Heligmosomoides polygyrus]|uniref:MOSC domain-containing protein n=1 Tax=Heligmosomoides polygyrus TaxID=6339 RepID=A0A183FIE2_HELPZ|nr:unnamed protein product [Heligmosomoides polygyrus]
MPILALEIKCNMVGVTDFTPSDPENHRWFLKVSCFLETACSGMPQEVLEVSGSRGEANLVEKCKLCSRVNTVAIVSDSIGKYNAADHNEEWQPLIQLDCRGLEPIDFDPRVTTNAITLSHLFFMKGGQGGGRMVQDQMNKVDGEGLPILVPPISCAP